MLGVKTIGNATLIAFDGEPILATDPWFEPHGVYFGSWALSRPVPAAERENILKSKYIWISHGHPDHLDSRSVAELKNTKILLPDHRGRRIYSDLMAEGFNVEIMPDRQWVQLSPRIKAMCISDYFQDAVLLVDVGGHLFVNLNDAFDRGIGRLIRSIASNYRNRYLLKLGGYGDASMINLYDEEGRFIEPRAALRLPVGAQAATYLRLYNCNHLIPFSSFHRYQRTDSAWANAYTTPIDAYKEKFDYKIAELHPAFALVDSVSGEVTSIPTIEPDSSLQAPEKFGDNWSDVLETSDLDAIRAYFYRREQVWQTFGWLNFRVGGRDNRIDMDGPHKIGITFEVPRTSLMAAIQYEIFDDLMIGNFMRTTLHGGAELYPDFTPVVARFADNGRAYSRSELAAYMADYRRRAPVEFMKHRFEMRTEDVVRKIVSPNSSGFRLAKRFYVAMKAR